MREGTRDLEKMILIAESFQEASKEETIAIAISESE